MKIKTKFNRGDVVYFIDQGEIRKSPILGIRVYVHGEETEQITIVYFVDSDGDSVNEVMEVDQVPVPMGDMINEKDCFSTPEKLAQHLLDKFEKTSY